MSAHSPLHAEIIESLLDFIDLRFLQVLRAADPYLDGIVAGYLNRAYNVALSRFVGNADGLRAVLRRTGAVISGSFALHFLDRARASSWVAHDLDIYAPQNHSCCVVHHLLHAERYVVQRHTQRVAERYPSSPRSIQHIVTLTRGDCKVDVIVSTSSSALLPIAGFWATHVMNYLSADSFCLAYPDLTFAGRALLHPDSLVHSLNPRPNIRTLMAKYEGRGFEFRLLYPSWSRMEDASAECDDGAGCPRTARYFGDLHCLMGSFQVQAAGFAVPGGLPNQLTVVWWRGGNTCGGRCQYGPDDVATFAARARTVPAEPLLRFATFDLPM